MYKYVKAGGKYVVSIDNLQEITQALTKFCEENNVQSGSISGIGAINEMTLRFFDPSTKQYVDICFAHT